MARRFTFWAVALAVLVIVVFNVQGWLVLRRTSQVLRQELGNKLQGLALTLSSVLAGRYDQPEGQRLLAEVMQSNRLFNIFVVNEELEYLMNARDPRQVSEVDPALELDAAEILSAFSGIPTQSRLYAAQGYYLATAYAPLTDAQGLTGAVLGVEADARFFTVLAGFRNSLYLTNALSLFAVVAIILVSVSLARHAFQVEQAASRANTLALMGQMSGAVAHEIRNPLGIIRAAAERLQKRFDPARAQPEFKYIQEEVDRLNRVISNYLSLGLSRTDATETVDLAQVLTEVVDSLAHDTSRLGIRVETEFHNLPAVRGDRLELRQVFLNLVLNAVQAQSGSAGVAGDAEDRRSQESKVKSQKSEVSQSGLLRVSGSFEQQQKQSWAVVRIEDQGPGVSSRDRHRIFEPFFTTKEKGSGLGLFVVRRTVEMLHGTVTVDSAPGQGTSVEVKLPAAEAVRSTE